MVKHILIVTQYIHPEPFKSSEMAIELVKRGYIVDVLTGIPNYPEGHYYDGYGLLKKRREQKEGVSYYRCFQTPRKLLPGFVGLSLNYLSFLVSATLWVFFYFIWKKRYDAIIAHEPSPITQIIPACILGDIKKTPVYSWIQDIWPDSVISTTGNKGQFLRPFLNSMTNWVYRHSTKLLVTSVGMKDLINRDADYSDKIVYYPQWADDMLSDANYNPLDQFHIKANSYKIMMAGTINDGIGINAVFNLLYELRNDNVVFIFVGGGNEENNLRLQVKEGNLSNVFFTGRRPYSEMSAYYAQADAMLLSLKATNMPHLKITVPARLQGYLSAAKPVLAMVDGCAAELISEADCGYTVHAGDYIALAKYIRNHILSNKASFSIKGQNARAYFETNFLKEKCITNLEKIIYG